MQVDPDGIGAVELSAFKAVMMQAPAMFKF